MAKVTVENFTCTKCVPISMPIIRDTLKKVRDQLLAHDINGGLQKFNMDVVCKIKTRSECGTAACIGGWASIFLLGFEGVDNYQDRQVVDSLFHKLLSFAYTETGDSRLHDLFYSFDHTENYNEPNVAATAINRYLRGVKRPWPRGKMPRLLPYTRRAYKPTK